MKQEFRVSLFFMFCVFGLMFSTTQAFGGFEPNLVGEQQRELNKENHSIDKDKKISRQQARRDRKKSRRLTKKRINFKKMNRSLILFLLSLLSVIIAVNLLSSVTILAIIVIILVVSAIIFGLIGIIVSIIDWFKNKSLLDILGLILNLLISSIAILGFILLDVI